MFAGKLQTALAQAPPAVTLMMMRLKREQERKQQQQTALAQAPPAVTLMMRLKRQQERKQQQQQLQ